CVDDARARPGHAEFRGPARAEARLRAVPAAPRPDAADRGLRRLSGSPTVDYLDRLARVVAATRLDMLPASTIAAAKLVLLDTLGAIVAGSAMPENGQLARLAAARGSQGGATVLGHRGKSDAFWAALANATAGVALEGHEGSPLGAGHPALHAAP